MSVQVHSTAIVAEGAVIGEGTIIGPYSIVGPRVVLGEHNKIASHVVIEGNTRIGKGNEFFQFCSIGSRPQDLKYRGEDSVLEIGDNNLIREYVTLQPGTTGGGMRTAVGSGNLFMVSSHLGHDSIVGDNNIFANGVAMAGHVTVGNGVILGGLVAVHQFVKLGDLAFAGGGSMVTQDVPPFCMAQGDRAELIGLNSIGMKRKGYSPSEIGDMKRLYREVFYGPGTLRERLKQIGAGTFDGARKLFLDFVAASKRGIAVPRVHIDSRSDDSAEE